jgi:hypothetical protein
VRDGSCVPPAPLRHQRCESVNSTVYCGAIFHSWKMRHLHYDILCCNLASLCVDIRVRDGSFMPPAPLRSQCSDAGYNPVCLLGVSFSYSGKCVSPTMVNWVADSLLFALISAYGMEALYLQSICRINAAQHDLSWSYCPLQVNVLLPHGG